MPRSRAAHSGDLPGVVDDPHLAPAWHFPLGDTDSASAFCALMDQLRAALTPDTVLDLDRKVPVIRQWVTGIARQGTANFQLSDGEFLYAHRSTRQFQDERRCVGSSEFLASDSLRARMTPAGERVRQFALVATRPLTAHESWSGLPAGEVVVFREDRQLAR